MHSARPMGWRGIGAVPILVLGFVLACASLPGPVAAAAPSLDSDIVQRGLQYPWDVAFTPDGEMLVTERPGRVRVYAGGALNAALLRTITIPSVHVQGEAGLMGIAVDVDYAANRFVYVCASRDVGGKWINQVLRYRVNLDLSWTAQAVLITGMQAAGNHDGCAVEMDPGGRLWVSMGDAGQPWLAQDPNSLNGKVLRVNRNGTIPTDNPIMPGAAGRTAVYSMGHRNPQGIAFRPDTGQVYAAEHGPDRDDEVNLIVAGANYGWPCYTGAGNPYLADPSCKPANAYSNPAWASGSPTIATSGLAFVDGSPWKDWDGNLFVSTLKQMDLRRFTPSGGGTTMTQRAILFDNAWGRLRAAARGPAGQLYLTTSNGSDDKVIRVAAAAPSVQRLSGPDRYATAAAISARTTNPGVSVAYVATGAAFPDALGGGAAAAHDGGPLLLVARNAIPPATADELTRLKPGRIVVLGGTGAISNAVKSALGAYTSGAVTRLAGADRYATAATISEATFSPGVAAAFIATGADFADALAGAPAAAHYGGPVLLTRRDDLPAVVAAELQRLKPQRIFVLGGTAAVSNAVKNALGAYTSGAVTRLAGADRFATAAAIAGLWDQSNLVYVATGLAFPDGLAGAAAAGRADVPLLVVRSTSVPTVIGQAIIRLHPTRIRLLGGTGAVSASVAAHLKALLGAP